MPHIQSWHKVYMIVLIIAWLYGNIDLMKDYQIAKPKPKYTDKYINYRIEFYELLILCFKNRLSIRQTRYILWTYHNNLSCKAIAILDGRDKSKQSINLHLQKAYSKLYRKLKHKGYIIGKGSKRYNKYI